MKVHNNLWFERTDSFAVEATLALILLASAKNSEFLLTARRDKAAALRFFEKAMKASSVSEKGMRDKSGANKVAIDGLNTSREIPVILKQVNYLSNIIEQDHRAIKRVTKPRLNLESFRSARK